MDKDRSRIAIATCSLVAGNEPDDLQIIAAIGQRGIEATHVAWDDPAVDWSTFDLVVIRSTWDYPSRLQDFLTWASRLPSVLNPLSILRWNTDKRYLADLAKVGLPVISTKFLGPGDALEVPSWPFVVKPAVSCSAKDTARYDIDDGDEAQAHVRRLHERGRTAMIQPYLSEIESAGETAVMFIGGHYSHTIRRDTVLRHTGLRPEEVLPPFNVRACEPTSDERLLADQVMANIPGGSSELLYARVDLIPGPDGKPLLMELELTEPSLFLEFSDGGFERLADCIALAAAD